MGRRGRGADAQGGRCGPDTPDAPDVGEVATGAIWLALGGPRDPDDLGAVPGVVGGGGDAVHLGVVLGYDERGGGCPGRRVPPQGDG